jgi:hypothetical protein
MKTGINELRKFFLLSKTLNVLCKFQRFYSVRVVAKKIQEIGLPGDTWTIIFEPKYLEKRDASQY